MTNEETAQKIQQINSNRIFLQTQLEQAQRDFELVQENISKTAELIKNEAFAEAFALASRNLEILQRAMAAVHAIQQSDKLSKVANEIERQASLLTTELQSALATVQQQELTAKVLSEALHDYSEGLNEAIEQHHWRLASAYCQQTLQFAPRNDWFRKKSQEISEHLPETKKRIGPKLWRGLLLALVIVLITASLFFVFWQQLEPTFVVPQEYTVLLSGISISYVVSSPNFLKIY